MAEKILRSISCQKSIIGLNLFTNDWKKHGNIFALSIYSPISNTTYLFDLNLLNDDYVKDELMKINHFFELFKKYIVDNNIKIVMCSSTAICDMIYSQFKITLTNVVDLKVL